MDMVMAIMNTTAMATPRKSRAQKFDEQGEALAVALHGYRQPASLASLKSGKLPKGLIDVLKAAAGDEKTLELSSKNYGATQEHIKNASQFYLQALLTTANDNPFRRLALEVDAGVDEIRDHKRWLLKWLHPDRNPNQWETKLFKLVNDAAQKLGQADVSTGPLLPQSKQKASRRYEQGRRWKIENKRRRDKNSDRLVRNLTKWLIIALLLFAVALNVFKKSFADDTNRTQTYFKVSMLTHAILNRAVRKAQI
jgi:hypothetical protein